ncbi:Exocyst complex subunit Sec8 [Trachipleistophora hominis]|uniref:Exocyst complex subunit Sec8 n=1 Tax=Trachipleistophora hominis TaxID=72359 RepID=L7JUA7_TRAHO|nr:Exocyst complex subunit Sec8 [Trachipleistophora hominis]
MNGDSRVNTILKELMVDWDDLAQADYNPLKNALELNDDSSVVATNFRNFYHKVDAAMAEIIRNKYRGFNDSVLIYTDINGLYRRLNKLILNMISTTNDCMLSLDLDITKIERENVEIKKMRAIQEYALRVDELHRLYVMYDKKLADEDFEFCTETIIKILESELDEVDAVKEMKSVFYHKRKLFLSVLYRKLDEYIFEDNGMKNEMEIVQDIENVIFRERRLLSYVVQLDGLLEFDNHVFYNLKFNFYRKVNKIINTGSELMSVFQRATDLFFAIIKKLCQFSYNLQMDNEENFYGEKYTKFRIFCLNGQQNVKTELKEELLRLVHSYARTRRVFDTKFKVENLIDFVNYEGLYENKYKIYERMVVKDGDKDLYADYTLIKKPSISNLFLFYDVLKGKFKNVCDESKGQDLVREDITKERAADGGVKGTGLHHDKATNQGVHHLPSFKMTAEKIQMEYKMELIHDITRFIKKMLRKEDRNLKHRIVRILNKEFSMERDYKTQRLFFFTHFINYFKPFTGRISFLRNFLWSFEYVTKKFEDNFSCFFRSQVISDSVYVNGRVNENERIFEGFKKQLLIKNIAYDDLALNKSNFDKIVFAILSLRDLINFYELNVRELERIDKNPRAESIISSLQNVYNAYNVSLSLEIILNVFYFFDKFYRDNDRSFTELFRVVNDMKKSLRCLHVEKEQFLYFNVYLLSEMNVSAYFISIFDVLNFYIVRNIRKLKVGNDHELRTFINDLKNMEEMLQGLSLGQVEGFDESFNFFEDVLNGKCTTEEAKLLRSKIR